MGPDVSYKQVRYTCLANDPTPKKRSGAPHLLSDQQINDTIAWIRESSERRNMSCAEIVHQRQLQCSPETLQRAFKRVGMTSHRIASQPLLDPQTAAEPENAGESETAIEPEPVTQPETIAQPATVAERQC